MLARRTTIAGRSSGWPESVRQADGADLSAIASLGTRINRDASSH
jgi:hypothetical protein